ncbi:MAG: hypothetical protein AABY32_00665 [Nanoarchaeota archaeon]
MNNEDFNNSIIQYFESKIINSDYISNNISESQKIYKNKIIIDSIVSFILFIIVSTCSYFMFYSNVDIGLVAILYLPVLLFLFIIHSLYLNYIKYKKLNKEMENEKFSKLNWIKMKEDILLLAKTKNN